MEISRFVREKKETDVLIVGGGTAGVFAAIAAARTGARTILIEKNSMLGGTLTVAGVNFPGLFFAWGKQIIAGPCWEAIERTVALGGAKIPEISFQPKYHYEEQILVNRFIFTAVINEMCRENGVEVLTNAMPAGMEESEEHCRLWITTKTGLLEITARKVIDATGDANLTYLAGYPLEKSPKQQPATPQNHLSGYVFEDIDPQDIEDAYPSAGFPDYLTAWSLTHYLRIHKIDIHIPCTDADTSEGRTRLEQESAALLLKVYQFYRQIKGLENLTMDFLAEETGVRETNRIVGETTITASDYINGTLYPDSISYAFYPIDLHVMKGIEQQFHKPNVVAKVPYRALIPKGSRHLLCAGRCISSDTYANSGIRVEAICMSTGQAAGCAAALAAAKNLPVKEVPFADLKEALQAIGAILPEH